MSGVWTFHQTVRGHLHIMNEFPCEDSSASFSAEDDRYHIAVVADGHGSKSCFRSDYGSKVATEVAIECLRQFAESALVSKEVEDRFYKDMFSNPRYRQMTLKQLTDTIVAGWHDRVMDHYKNNPPTAEEMGESAEEYEHSKNPAHIYGTTLIAALQMPKCLVLVHQGDGRCDVFYPDGTVDQPIPWDERCEDTATTSLCDEDAANRFRSKVIDLVNKPVVACYLGSDGVEDAYRDTYEELGGSHVLMGGVHTFYKDLTCQLADRGQAEFEDYLKTMLPDFSANGRFSRSGSGDDVSVAGIVDLDAIGQLVDKYQYDVNCYALDEALFWKEDELRGKSRKHGILKKRMEDAQSALDDALKKQQLLANALQQLKQQREELALEVEQAKMELEGYSQEVESASSQINGKYARLSAAIQRFFDELSNGYSCKEAEYRKMLEKLLDYDDQLTRGDATQRMEAENIKELEAKFAEAKTAFEEYDAKYQAIDAQRLQLMDEIAALQKKSQE